MRISQDNNCPKMNDAVIPMNITTGDYGIEHHGLEMQGRLVVIYLKLT